MSIEWSKTYAAVYRRKKDLLKPVRDIDPINIEELVGIDTQKNLLMKNTRAFLEGKPANNALLWGARGSGKSSLIKAVFNYYKDSGLRLIEIDKEDLKELLDIVDGIRELDYKFIIYCDDLSFDSRDGSYRSLKSVLDGSIELPPKNVLLYATSNRRHLVSELQSDNVGSIVNQGELHYSDSAEEKISLADRFGLWLSFYQGGLDDYLKIVDSYFKGYNVDKELLHSKAKRFSAMRGGVRNGRCAKQFFNHFVDKI